MTGEIALQRKGLLCRVCFLLVSVVAFAPVPSMAMVTSGSSISGGQAQRLIQEQPIEVGELPMVDRNGDGIAYNPCSLCQGLEILEDKIASPLTGNSTCGELSSYLEYQPEAFGISYDSCRSAYLFNILFESCCRPSVPLYKCEQNVHNYFQEQDYNTVVPPIVGFDEEDRLNVNVSMIYQALENIDVGEGTATIFVTFTMEWKDARLAWDVEDNNTCANLVNIWTGYEVEKTGIWIPDLQLLNEIDGLQTMPDYKAHVYADGTVWWTVSGGLKAFCAFRNLAKIPFDTLGCQMLFGGGTREHTTLIRYQLEQPEYLVFGAFDVTYNEWKAVPEMGQHGFTFNDTVIYYNVYFKRATVHYISNIVYPTVILTYLSFFTFLLDMRVGERLGFGMAIALVVIAQQIVTSGMTPISDQRLWLDKFVAWSFYWVLIGVIESVLVGFLFYVREDAEAKKEAQSKQENTTDEEFEPLVMEATEAIKVEEVKPNSAALEPSDEDTTSKDCCLIAIYKGIIYKYPLRKLDMIALIISTTTYTLFVIGMVATGTSDTWLADEPDWFDESTNPELLMTNYVNGDPNN